MLQRFARRYSKELGILVLLISVCAFLAIRNPRFLSPINLQNTTRLIGMYGILSLGIAIIIVTGGIDLSVGSLVALFGVFLAFMLVEWKWAPLLALLAILVAGAGVGAVHATLISKLRLQPFIVTLCGLLIYRGLARKWADDKSMGFGTGEGFGWLKDLATGNTLEIPNPFLLLIGLSVVFGIVLHKSVYGRYLFAIGRNEEAARFSGVPTRRVEAGAYIIGSTLAALSSVLFAFYTNSISPSSHGNFYELYGIAAAVLGGFSLRGGEGSIFGVLLGAALLQVLQNLVNLLGISSSLNFAVMGAVILLGVIVDNLVLRRRTT
jgi:ribose transport system permease protein